jgi:hypothetical protein
MTERMHCGSHRFGWRSVYSLLGLQTDSIKTMPESDLMHDYASNCNQSVLPG